MRSMPAAMAWEFWQRSRFDLLIGLAGAIGAPGLLYSFFSINASRGQMELDGPAMVYIDFVFLIIAGSVLATVVLSGHGSPSRLYVRPVATWMLVLCQMLQSMAAMFLLYALSASVLNLVLRVGWPVFGPALFFSVTVAGIQAASWPKTELPQGCASVLVAAAAFFWLKWRFGGGGFAQPTQVWTSVTAGDLWTMASASIAAYVVAVSNVARHRSGEQEWWPAVERWFDRVTARQPARQEPLPSPAAAQAWSLRQNEGLFIKGLFGILFGGVVIVCLVLGILGWSPDVIRLLRFIGGAAAFGVISAGYVFGFAMAVWNLVGPPWTMRPFIASRPEKSTDLSAIVLKVGATSIFWTMAWGGLGLLLAMAVFAASGHADAVAQFCRQPIEGRAFALLSWARQPLWSVLQFVASILLVAWSIMGLSASLTLAGHHKILASYIAGAILLAGVCLYVVNFHLPSQLIPVYMAGLLAAFGLASVIGTSVAFVAARRRRLVSARAAWWSCAGWLALCSTGEVLWFSSGLPWLVFGCGLCALPFAPLATAPLAVVWNRHC